MKKISFSNVICTGLALLLFASSAFAQGERRNRRKDNDWTAEEYSGTRNEGDLRAALASKGFTWITGSPADNETLSVGKNAQFFGFVALRYQSGRAANRGVLGRAFFAIATPEQRALMANAVRAEKAELSEWWAAREEILTLLENHLYTGEVIDPEVLAPMGETFSLLNAQVAIHEARAFATLEDSLTDSQRDTITGWRADAESAGASARNVRVTASGLERSDSKQLEDLWAKAFSWLTGTAEDNEIIPIGQPAQFFGFVAIRHKSGHAASRGTIAKDFFEILNEDQQEMIHEAVRIETPIVQEFLRARHEFLNQLANLRTSPDEFDERQAHRLAEEMGRLEVQAANIEAETYARIRAALTEPQLGELMAMRGNYVLDESQVATLDMAQRGETLAILCSGCHGAPGRHRNGMPAPTLDGFWDRPIATDENFEYSDAMTELRGSNLQWTPQLLDQFLAEPKRFAPGTKMEFQGLLNAEDRAALIQYLQTSR